MFEMIIVAAIVLALFASIMVFALRQRQRESEKVMEAYEAGDRPAVRKYVLSGILTLTGFAALIGFEEGVDGVITVLAVSAVLVCSFLIAVSVARLWKRRVKRDDPSSDPGKGNDSRLLLGTMLLACAVFVGGTAALVELHGATTITIYYVVVPLVTSLILFLQRSCRRLRRSPNPDSGRDGNPHTNK